MKVICFLTVLLCIAMINTIALGQLVDSFSDGDFTSNPTWTGDTASWEIVTNSDVAAGASNSNTLRLSVSSGSGTQYLGTQRSGSWGSEQSWSFWLGRRYAATNQNHSLVWLWASEADLESGTVDGYRVRFGDNTDDDNIVLQRVDDGTVTNRIISTGTVPNGLTDIGFIVRVTRTSASLWTLYTSALPTANGEGAIATDIPSAANTPVSQGNVTDSTYTAFDNGYWGVIAVHSSTSDPRAGAEFDQFYFDTDSDASLPVTLSSFTAIRTDSVVTILWTTETETDHVGWNIYRSEKKDGKFVKINEKLIKGSGNSGMPITYQYVDKTAIAGRQYYYYLEDLDLFGNAGKSDIIGISKGKAPSAKDALSITWGAIKQK